MIQKAHAVTVVLASLTLAGCGPSAEEPAGVYTYAPLPPLATQGASEPSADSQAASSAAPSSAATSTAAGHIFRAATSSGTVVTAVLDAEPPADLDRYFDEMGAEDYLSFVTVTADPTEGLDSSSVPQLIGPQTPAMLEIASGTHGTGGHIGDAAPAQWGDGGEMYWTGEMVSAETMNEYNEWALKLIDKYDSAAESGYLVYITDGEQAPEEVTAVQIDYGGEQLHLTPVE